MKLRKPMSWFATGMLLSAVVGCASVAPRVEFSADDQAKAEVVGLEGVRTWADAPVGLGLEQWLPPSRDIVMLALSGGADGGAYGAGFLNGWTASESRPSFSIVSGISTGALIAPFAFLGPDYDQMLRELYTETSAADVFRLRSPIAGLLGSSFADTAPMQRRISELVTPKLLAAIAREHRQGRRLFVVTTNLDAQRAVVWNMGEIATRNDPNALTIFRRVLLASAAIPGVFPPVLIDVEANGRRFQEMHVDGGTMTQILTVTEPLLIGGNPPPGRRSLALYALINKKYDAEFSIVKSNTLNIINRSFSTITKSSTKNSIISTYNYAKNNNVMFRFTFIGDDFPLDEGKPFDVEYMGELFGYGYRRAQSARAWIAAPTLATRQATAVH
ncbi:patatin-like phospholipase family protein [Bauldia litoralis]|uniref:patatin-like phospholipase family protein n=1 Tax=Bauldia litoralis TaxID=665467 RepID=UPI003265C5BF